MDDTSIHTRDMKCVILWCFNGLAPEIVRNIDKQPRKRD